MKFSYTNFLTVIMWLFLATGCAMNQPIKYDMSDIQESSNSILKSSTLSVMEFTDSRKDNQENDILFTRGREASLEDGRHCINSEEHYNKENVVKQISSKFVDHLNKKNIFKSVTLNNKEQSDFYLTGNVHKFYGKQEYSYKAAVGSQFGLIGALLVSGIKTKGHTEIIISDLSIYDKEKNIVATLNDISEIYDGELIADAYCWQIYWTLNDQLKHALEKAILNMEEKLSKKFTGNTYSNK